MFSKAFWNTPIPLPKLRRNHGTPALLAIGGKMGASNARREYIDQRYFIITMAVAALFHLGGFYILDMIPNDEVVDIPVRALSITLNDEDPSHSQDMASIQPETTNHDAVDDAILSSVIEASDIIQAKSAAAALEKAASDAGSAAQDATESALAQDTDLVLPTEGKKQAQVKQFVRNTNVKAPASARGNTTEKEADLVSRYEQLISLWIEKFKKYPMEARKQNIQGETIVRIRIDRQGNIRYYILEYSTGSTILDRAAIDMVRRANPVPAVPDNYPDADLMEFLVPVGFGLQ